MNQDLGRVVKNREIGIMNVFRAWRRKHTVLLRCKIDHEAHWSDLFRSIVGSILPMIRTRS
jgi:hypothetical protein